MAAIATMPSSRPPRSEFLRSYAEKLSPFGLQERIGKILGIADKARLRPPVFADQLPIVIELLTLRKQGKIPSVRIDAGVIRIQDPYGWQVMSWRQAALMVADLLEESERR